MIVWTLTAVLTSIVRLRITHVVTLELALSQPLTADTTSLYGPRCRPPARRRCTHEWNPRLHVTASGCVQDRSIRRLNRADCGRAGGWKEPTARTDWGVLDSEFRIDRSGG
jgi:hypothetical protein